MRHIYLKWLNAYFLFLTNEYPRYFQTKLLMALFLHYYSLFYLSHLLLVLCAYFCEKLLNFGRMRQNLMNKIWLRITLVIARDTEHFLNIKYFINLSSDFKCQTARTLRICLCGHACTCTCTCRVSFQLSS